MPVRALALERPASVEDACRLLAEAQGEGRALAGGTDLLVGLKLGLPAPRLLVSIAHLDGLRGVRLMGSGALFVAAGERLAEVSASPLVRAHAGALAQACDRVAHPQVRWMGTLGGNLCLDVRCRYIDQSAAWRASLGGCLKCDGAVCHVVAGAAHCVAALSGDTVAPLTALRAEVEVVGPRGARRIDVTALRARDGVEPVTIDAGELVTGVVIPAAPPGRLSAYHKWAVRRAIDFPLVSVALVCDRDAGGRIDDLQVAVSVLGPRPKRVTGLARFRGERLTELVAAAAAEVVMSKCRPLANVLYDPDYRQRLLGVMVRRQLTEWATLR